MQLPNGLARSLCGLVAALGFAALRPAPAGAQDAGWAELAGRIALSHSNLGLYAKAGAEPPNFRFPLSARPLLPLIGSAWWAYAPNAWPAQVHLYYAPSPRTAAAATALVSKLTAAGYARVTRSGFSNGFVGEFGPGEKWCSSRPGLPEVDMEVKPVGGVPALDLFFSVSGCRVSTTGPGSESPIPSLGGIAGMRIYPRVRASGGRENFLGSAAVVRTALPPAEAVAKLADRFTANGWRAEPAVVDGTAIVQRFSRTVASRRWDALLFFTGTGTIYDAVLDVTNVPEPAR